MYNTVSFLYKQPVYKQLGLDLQKVKQLLGLKHVTISNLANKIFAYENIATTLHNHILYTANVNLQDTLFKCMLQLGFENFILVNRLSCKNGKKTNKFKQSIKQNGQYFKQLWGLGP